MAASRQKSRKLCLGPAPGQTEGPPGLELFRAPNLLADSPAFVTHRVCCNGVFWSLSWYDSRADLGFSNRTSSTVALMLGNGDGTFAAATYSVVTNGPQDIAAGDLNGDGKLDYATPNAGANNVSVRLGQGDGTFSNLTGFPAGADRPVAIAIADLDRDGKLDLAIAVTVEETPSWSH